MIGFAGRFPRAVLGALVLTALSAGTAFAEPVRLRSGAVLEVTKITLDGESFVLALEVGAGKGTMRLPLAQVEPADLVRLLRTRVPETDAAGQMRVARAALDARLYDEALERAARAKQLDPSLIKERTRIIAAVQSARASDAVAEAEVDLRAGRLVAARARLRALLDNGLPVHPPDLEAARARLLLGLVERAIAAAKGTPPAAPAPVAPAAPAAPPAPAAPDAAAIAALAQADAFELRALAAREAAADPALPAARREALLGDAAVDLLNARRLLIALPVATTPDLLARLEALRAFLVATWLDLADLARNAGRWLDALDLVQAALILEPENDRAREIRRWINDDMRAPASVPYEPPVYFGGYGFGSSSTPFATRAHGGGAYVRWRSAPHPAPHGGTVHHRGQRSPP